MKKREEHSRAVEEMFSRIAPRYDLMNRLMTLGQDRVWRQKMIQALDLPHRGRVLDLGCGTGDIALAAREMRPGLSIVGADYTGPMLHLAKERPGAQELSWMRADAMALPFKNASFDAVVSGYLLRNVPDIDGALAEQARVLKPAGSLACLDTAPPGSGPVGWGVKAFLRFGIPLLGGLLTGDRAAYEYLPETTENFLSPPLLAARLKKAGFTQIRWQSFMMGTQTVMIAKKG